MDTETSVNPGQDGAVWLVAGLIGAGMLLLLPRVFSSRGAGIRGGNTRRADIVLRKGGGKTDPPDIRAVVRDVVVWRVRNQGKTHRHVELRFKDNEHPFEPGTKLSVDVAPRVSQWENAAPIVGVVREDAGPGDPARSNGRPYPYDIVDTDTGAVIADPRVVIWDDPW